jgi:hypothetical protein
MSQATPIGREQRFANVTALCHELKEMAARAKLAKPAASEPMSLQRPVLVVRGK